ncbi:D-alanine--D-alanine ligase B [bacterium BMS3Abin03]|nr:D-alanine--D-alanine ligase B [bacterium BMS3Abin03]
MRKKNFKTILKLVDLKHIIIIFGKKKLKGKNILSKTFNHRLNVALTYNVKPESEAFYADLSPNQTDGTTQIERAIDTFAEWDTRETINALEAALKVFHDVELIEATDEAFIKLKESKPDIVFNIAEGLNGISRESQIPAMLDMLNIPYTGSDALTLGICLDKSRAKEILTYHRIPNAKFFVIDKYQTLSNHALKFPLIIKPVSEGSSKGIFGSSLVKNYDKLNAELERVINEYKQPALIEEYLPGREFTVAVIGNDDEARILPIIEIRYDEFPDDVEHLYSYEAKWILDTKESDFNVFDCPANIDRELEKQIKEIALKTYKVLRCKDWSRIDIRLDKNNVPNIIEVNPLPGIMPDPNENSSFPKAARAAGLDYNQMIQTVLHAAAKRYNLS